MNTETATRKPFTIPAGSTVTLDALTRVPVTTVIGSKLREGMVLVDPELETPACVLDSYLGSTRNSGNRRFSAISLVDNRMVQVPFFMNGEFKVMAR